MSKWTDVRDNIVDALNVDVVTDELKDQMCIRDSTYSVSFNELQVVKDVVQMRVAAQGHAHVQIFWDEAGKETANRHHLNAVIVYVDQSIEMCIRDRYMTTS